MSEELTRLIAVIRETLTLNELYRLRGVIDAAIRRLERQRAD